MSRWIARAVSSGDSHHLCSLDEEVRNHRLLSARVSRPARPVSKQLELRYKTRVIRSVCHVGRPRLFQGATDP